jgi:hypothetical protein
VHCYPLKKRVVDRRTRYTHKQRWGLHPDAADDSKRALLTVRRAEDRVRDRLAGDRADPEDEGGLGHDIPAEDLIVEEVMADLEARGEDSEMPIEVAQLPIPPHTIQ